ncbi:MAG: DNA/RNA helicase domain-containing protein, partial [Gammaproteobacteria bacterium]
MYVLKSYPFNKEGLSELKKLEPFPSVYIIENGNEIYIGEGIDPVKRLKTHLRDKKVKSPAKMHIISNYDFNVSVAKDLESYLIQLIKAEGKYKMINKDQLGIRHNYYMKNSYQQRFNHIWKNLIEMGIGHSSEEEIKNTQIYEFSPFKSLTSDQQYIVDEILTQINEGTYKVFIVEGDPGSGKTILANYLLKELTEQGKDAALVFSMTSIRKTVQEVFKSVLGMNEKVIGPADLRKKKYEVLIVDEAHRLNRRKNLANYGIFDKVNQHFGLDNDGDQLDWISKSADITILFYDSLQSIKPSDIEPEKLQKYIEDSNALVLK